MDDLKERLHQRHAYEAAHYPPPDGLWKEAAARIAALEEQLAGRDAEIAAWLRSRDEAGDYDWGPGMDLAADLIERGDYRKDAP